MYYIKLIGNKCNKYPKIKLGIINDKTINKFSFLFLFSLNKTIKPIPALTDKPAIIEPNVKPPARYSSVKTTEDTQFGISPIKIASSGWRMLFASSTEINLSSPMYSTNKPNKKLKMNI